MLRYQLISICYSLSSVVSNISSVAVVSEPAYSQHHVLNLAVYLFKIDHRAPSVWFPSFKYQIPFRFYLFLVSSSINSF